MNRRTIWGCEGYTSKPKNLCHRSAVIVWTVISMVVIIGFTALAVDMGYTYHTRTELQRTADAAAMAAASMLTEITETSDDEAVRDTAQTFAQKNKIGCLQPTLDYTDVVLGRTDPEEDGKCSFNPGVEPYDAVKVTVRLSQDSPNGPLSLFFGSALGVPTTDLSASAIATLVPRDLAIVIDLSNSMSYDSQLRHESTTDINIREVWQDLGSPTFGNMTTFHNSAAAMTVLKDKTDNQLKAILGLNGVPFPSAGGNWNDYFKYMNGSGSSKDNKRILDDYENRYGLRTLVNYLLDCRALATETPALKNCHVQPVTALKDAVEELCNILMISDSGDRVALISYSNNADVEVELTNDYMTVTEAVRQQQAGQKGSSTNIANGIERARQELKSSRARPAARKVMVVMTDGKANLPSNEKDGKLQAIHAGNSAVNQGIQIYTISLGTEADQELMEDLATIGKGVHFHVATFNIEQYEEDLKRIYRSLGGKRPIRLIQ